MKLFVGDFHKQLIWATEVHASDWLRSNLSVKITNKKFHELNGPHGKGVPFEEHAQKLFYIIFFHKCKGIHNPVHAHCQLLDLFLFFDFHKYTSTDVCDYEE